MGKSHSGKSKSTNMQFCLCIDYRKVNSILPAVTQAIGTKKGTFALMPLPKIAELFVLSEGAKYFTVLDLQSCYYHIKLDEESIPKSAYDSVFGKFEFPRLPFGLSKGSDFFIHLIYDLFGLDKVTMLGQGCRYMAYLDEMLDFTGQKRNNPEILDSFLQMSTQSQTQNQVEQMFIL